MGETTGAAKPALLPGGAGGDPIEGRLRETVRATIEALSGKGLAAFPGRLRHGRDGGPANGCRRGRRQRRFTGTCGTGTVRVPRAGIEDDEGKTAGWRSRALPRSKPLGRKAGALIAAVRRAVTNGPRGQARAVRAVSGRQAKHMVSRAGRKMKLVRDAGAPAAAPTRTAPALAIVPGSMADKGSLLDGTVIRTRLDREAANVPVLAMCGVRRPSRQIAAQSPAGQGTAGSCCCPIRTMGGDSAAARRRFLETLDARGPKRSDFVIVDGAPGLEAALAALWSADPALHGSQASQPPGPCPKRMQDALTGDCREMIHADTAAGVETRRKAHLREWRATCRAVADSIEQAVEGSFAFTRLATSRWKSARTLDAIERPSEAFRRRVEAQTVLPRAGTVPMPRRALPASGLIAMRRVDGRETLSRPPAPMTPSTSVSMIRCRSASATVRRKSSPPACPKGPQALAAEISPICSSLRSTCCAQ